MVRSLTALAALTVCSGVLFIACDKDDASTTSTTSALYDAGVLMAQPPISADQVRTTSTGPTSVTTPNGGMNVADPNVAVPGNAGVRHGAPGAPLPRAVSPESPANGYGTANGNPAANTPSAAGSMNGGGAMNGTMNGNMYGTGAHTGPSGVPGANTGIGAVNNGNSAGSMNGTQPMNQLGSSGAPYRSPNGATDSPRPAPPPPGSVP